MLCTSMALDYTKQKKREHLTDQISGRFGVRMKDIRQTFAVGHVVCDCGGGMVTS